MRALTCRILEMNFRVIGGGVALLVVPMLGGMAPGMESM
jgi:hypothetical protein